MTPETKTGRASVTGRREADIPAVVDNPTASSFVFKKEVETVVASVFANDGEQEVVPPMKTEENLVVNREGDETLPRVWPSLKETARSTENELERIKDDDVEARNFATKPPTNFSAKTGGGELDKSGEPPDTAGRQMRTEILSTGSSTFPDSLQERSAQVPPMHEVAIIPEAPGTQETSEPFDLPPPKGVSFSVVEIREYEQTIGDNPSCSYGPPVSLDWNYTVREEIDLDVYEATRPPRRLLNGLMLNYYQRRDLLILKAGFSLKEIEQVTREMDTARRKRTTALFFSPISKVEEVCLSAKDTIKSAIRRKGREEQRNEGMIMETMRSDVEAGTSNSSAGLLADGSLSDIASSSTLTSSRRVSRQRHVSRSVSSISGEETTDCEDLYVASEDSRFFRYNVKVDRAQHDMASEIILWQFKRPHMRAFHAAWLSFFVAFFTWFSITPLLNELEDSLLLTKEEIWTSSLCGTASTIVMRLLVGPACDKFGARVCMTFILAASALPTALTGLTTSPGGLCALRAFVGIAGSSFVACQYWTSTMFTKEVAGTANALVAGWGNLGGGVTQVAMGSVFFPLFKAIYFNEDESAEKAWRTVFVVPALLSLATAIWIYFYSDDSPKGNVQERTRQERVLFVNPAEAFCTIFHSWNAWILSIQYACCFGVEVTMINAVALYFHDEFGQTTESAAALAAIFGFMNLFARGVGGFLSDMFNARSGMRGRLWWQFLTLFVQGFGIILFGRAGTLAGALFALIFASLFVQSAEGSTFGIVPYVHRRFTGAVVGMVGAGGNVGGAMFAIMFRQLSYTNAFTYMGTAAAASAFLSFLINTNHLSFMGGTGNTFADNLLEEQPEKNEEEEARAATS